MQLSDAVEDINRAHAQDRIQLSQANKECMTVVEEVSNAFRFSFWFLFLTLSRCAMNSSKHLPD